MIIVLQHYLKIIHLNNAIIPEIIITLLTWDESATLEDETDILVH